MTTGRCATPSATVLPLLPGRVIKARKMELRLYFVLFCCSAVQAESGCRGDCIARHQARQSTWDGLSSAPDWGHKSVSGVLHLAFLQRTQAGTTCADGARTGWGCPPMAGTTRRPTAPPGGHSAPSRLSVAVPPGTSVPRPARPVAGGAASANGAALWPLDWDGGTVVFHFLILVEYLIWKDHLSIVYS